MCPATPAIRPSGPRRSTSAAATRGVSAGAILGDGDHHLAERLTLFDRRRNRLIVGDGDLHVLARFARYSHDEVVRDRQRHLRPFAEPHRGLVHRGSGGEQRYRVVFAERPLDQPLALLRARLRRGQPAQHDQNPTVAALGGSDQAVAGFLGVAGFQSIGAEILIEERIAVPLRDLVEGEFLLAIDLVELRKVLDRAHRHRREIMRRHPVIRVRQPIDIGEMAVLEPDFFRLAVHLLDKRALAAGQALGQHDAGVIAGLDDHSAYQVGNFHALAERDEHFRAAGAPCLFADRQLVIELRAALFQVVEDNICRHQLRHRRGRNAFLGVLVEQNRAGLHLHHQGRARLRVDRADSLQRNRRFRLAGRRAVVRTRLRRGDGGRADRGDRDDRHRERGRRGNRTKPAQNHFASSPF